MDDVAVSPGGGLAALVGEQRYEQSRLVIQVGDLLDAPQVVTAGQVAGMIGDAEKVEPGGIERVAHGFGQRPIQKAAVFGNIGMSM
jgi:hypothetical protein